MTTPYGRRPHGRRRTAFCTGLDRDAHVPQPNSPYMMDDPLLRIGPKANDLWKPVIAAVRGMACGGAFYLLGESEFRRRRHHRRLLRPAHHVRDGERVRVGVHGAPHAVRRAARMALMGTAERISARRAYETGLVSELTDPGGALEAALRCAAVVASYPQEAVQGTVRARGRRRRRRSPGRSRRRRGSSPSATCPPNGRRSCSPGGGQRGSGSIALGQSPPCESRGCRGLGPSQPARSGRQVLVDRGHRIGPAVVHRVDEAGAERDIYGRPALGAHPHVAEFTATSVSRPSWKTTWTRNLPARPFGFLTSTVAYGRPGLAHLTSLAVPSAREPAVPLAVDVGAERRVGRRVRMPPQLALPYEWSPATEPPERPVDVDDE